MNKTSIWKFVGIMLIVSALGLQGCDSHDERGHSTSESHDEHDHDEKESHDEHDHDEKESHDEHDHDEKESHGEHDHDEKESHDEHDHDEKESHDEHDHDEKESHDEHDHDEKESHDEHDYDKKESHDEHGHSDEEQVVRLSQQQRSAADIQTAILKAQEIHTVIQAPGEVLLNDYATSKTTPRIDAEIINRHAKLGDTVTEGQPLVTLSSVEMASAQGELMVAEREWQRVRKLGRKVVSESRYVQARVAREQARSKVLAYGMTRLQLDNLLKSGKLNQANGEFQLLAAQNGTVIRDHFIQGELVSAGTVLFEITDESVLWVEARLTPEQAAQIDTGAKVTVKYQKNVFQGKVVQAHHALDARTRTLGVRVAVNNPDDVLHPGLFVQVTLETNHEDKAMALPVDAVLRSPDGHWLVFVEHEDNEFEPLEVELIRTVGDRAVIEGIDADTRAVVSGAFFLQSELAKSGFDIHNH